MALWDWRKLPTGWIKGDGLDPASMGLRQFRWGQGTGSSFTAALMLLLVIAHHADDEGAAHLTYDKLSGATGLSRAKVATGLQVLEEGVLIQRFGLQRNHLQLANYNPRGGWGMIPAKKLYDASGQVRFFKELKLRSPSELHALKLYLLFIAMRGNGTNMAQVSYDKIEVYLDIARQNIKSGLSMLAANSLIHIEHLPSRDKGVSNGYRIVHLNPTSHMGTTGRNILWNAEFPSASDTEVIF